MNNDKLQKIMYIEDEPDITAIAKIALEEIGGFTLQTCTSGKQALQEAPAFNPDLFLIDMMMPEMDGLSTLKALRKIPQFVETPIVFMTAKTQAHEVKEYLSIGALAVITKPFDPMSLATTINEIWKKKNEKSSA